MYKRQPYGTSKWWFVKADQKWNDKWSSFVRFVNVDYDTDYLDDATEWGVGIGYQYTPAIAFRLAYDQVDYGSDNLAGFKDVYKRQGLVRAIEPAAVIIESIVSQMNNIFSEMTRYSR